MLTTDFETYSQSVYDAVIMDSHVTYESIHYSLDRVNSPSLPLEYFIQLESLHDPKPTNVQALKHRRWTVTCERPV